MDTMGSARDCDKSLKTDKKESMFSLKRPQALTHWKPPSTKETQISLTSSQYRPTFRNLQSMLPCALRTHCTLCHVTYLSFFPFHIPRSLAKHRANMHRLLSLFSPVQGIRFPLEALDSIDYSLTSSKNTNSRKDRGMGK